MVCGEMKFTWLCFALIVVPNLGGWIGGIAVSNNREWYNKLVKPPAAPPEWVYGPMWTILYCLMGFASYLVWEERKLLLGRQSASIRPESQGPESQEPESRKLQSNNEAKNKRVWNRLVGLMRRKSWIPIVIYLLQLVLNWIWTWFFFQLKLSIWPIIDLCLLDVTVAVCLVCFGIVRLAAGALLVPYMLWIIFATYINIYVATDERNSVHFS